MSTRSSYEFESFFLPCDIDRSFVRTSPNKRAGSSKTNVLLTVPFDELDPRRESSVDRSLDAKFREDVVSPIDVQNPLHVTEVDMNGSSDLGQVHHV